MKDIAPPTRFRNSRGRPKQDKPECDTGTPELQFKRAHGLTTEALDYILERQLITEKEHWCGIHFRWLYTLRFGAPGVRAVDPAHIGGRELRSEDPEWKAAREAEFRDAMAALERAGASFNMLDICIFNERPAFLSLSEIVTESKLKHIQDELNMLERGFDILVKLWKNGK